MGNMFHTHLHSEFSILDGYTKVSDIPKIAKEHGDDAVALTDHGSLAAGLRFWKAGKEYGIRTVQGVEGYVTPDLTVKDKDSPTWHMILLAANKTGLDNLYALSGKSWTDGFYRKPRIDHKFLKEHSEGIIATSSCMAGEVARAIEEQNVDGAAEAVRRYLDIYGHDNFYIELQPGNTKELNSALANLADDLSVRKIVAVDSHYDHKECRGNEELLLIMQQVAGFKASDKEFAKLMADEAKRETTLINRLNKLWPNRTLRFDHHDLYIMDSNEVVERMNAQGFDGQELVDATLEIAEKCEQIEFETGRVLLPKVSPPDVSSDDFLKALVRKGLEERGLFDDPVYRERAKEELAILSEKGFSDYFLIVWDIIREARSRDIYVGPGRGSAAGSLVAYALKITSIDPIKFKLLFFRFINPERNDFPDIDMDFEHTRRDEMKEYMRDKYGEALSLSTFSEFKAKGLVRSIARSLSIPLDEVEKACKHFDSLDEYEESTAENLKSFKARHPEVLPIAKEFEGHISGTGMHAAALVIADRPMNEIVPIETRVDPEDKTRRVPVSAFNMHDAADVGLIKYDFLGLVNLTILHDCIKLIKERYGLDIDWENLPIDDGAVLNSLSNAHTVGVFQMESSPYRKLLTAMGVDSLEDLVASNALVRPGAFLTVAQDYINRKKGRENVVYPHESVEEDLKDTYGTYIYQEQVMQMLVKMGEFSWGKADKVRKIIGKKLSPEEFEPYYLPWLENAGAKVGKKMAEKIWHDFEKHAGYSFNRSHAVCYSYIGYVTAWVKHYYPLEYMYSLLRNEKNDMSKMTYLLEARRLGIEILPPDINISSQNTTVEGNALRFGLLDVKNVGFAAAEEIVNKRPFTTWEDFSERISARKCNSKVVESLVAVDALASVKGAPRHSKPSENYQAYLNYPVALESIAEIGLDFDTLEAVNEADDESQFWLVCGVIKDIKRTPTYVRLEIEDATGNTTVFGAMSNDLSKGEVCIALIGDRSMIGHTRVEGFGERIAQDSLSPFEQFILGKNFKDIDQLRRYGIGKLGAEKALVVPLQVKEITTKKGQKMAFVYLTDGEEIAKVTIFAGPWATLQKQLFDWVPVCVKLSRLEDGGYTLWNDNVINAAELLRKKLGV